MAQIIDGKAVSRAVRARVAQETLALKEQGVTPGLAVILVGEDPASQVYVRNKEKACAEVGFYSEKYTLPADTTQAQLNALVDELNAKKEITGILCQLHGISGGHNSKLLSIFADQTYFSVSDLFINH